MTQEEECIAAYNFLTQALRDYGLDDVVAEIEQEMQLDDTISYEDLPDMHDEKTEASTSKRKRKEPPSGQTMLPGISASPNLNPFSLDTFYSPQKRLHMLIDAIERAVADPVYVGDFVMRALEQESIILGSRANNEQVFVLTNEDIRRHRESANELKKWLSALRAQLLSQEHS